MKFAGSPVVPQHCHTPWPDNCAIQVQSADDRADTTTVRAWAGFAVVVALAVASGGGTAGGASVRPHAGSRHSIQAGPIHLVDDHGVDCHFTTVNVGRTAGRHRGHPTTPGGPGGSTAAADVTVEIPPVVLIHLDRQGRDLDVFTNTGSRPQVGDEFYTVARHRNAAADAALTREVIERCSAPRHPSDPH